MNTICINRIEKNSFGIWRAENSKYVDRARNTQFYDIINLYHGGFYVDRQLKQFLNKNFSTL